MEIKIVNNSNNPLPKYETAGASGLDLKADLEAPVKLGVMEIKTISTGLQMEIPEGYEMQIRPRSGLASKKGVIAVLGTIDSDFRGTVCVILINLGTESFEINNGDRIAQMVLCPIEKIDLCPVLFLNETERGSNGFGSTGI